MIAQVVEKVNKVCSAYSLQFLAYMYVTLLQIICTLFNSKYFSVLNVKQPSLK